MTPQLLLAEKQTESSLLDGYTRLYRCVHSVGGEPCGKIFRAKTTLAKHVDLKHGKVRRLLYKSVPANGDYIKTRLAQCQTQEIKFAHHDKVRGSSNYDECDGVRSYLNSCDLRVCEQCEGHRKYRYSRKIEAAVNCFQRASVLTLTFRGYRPLSRAEKRTVELQTRNFMKVLCRKFGSYNVQYIRVLELKKHHKKYFYHYHYIIDMPYIKQEIISEAFKTSTGDSMVVWVEILKDGAGRPVGINWGRLRNKQKVDSCMNYVAKYLSKPMGTNIDPELYAQAVYGKHFVESRIDQDLLNSYNGRNSSTETGVICPKCQESLEYWKITPLDLTNTGSAPPPQDKLTGEHGFLDRIKSRGQKDYELAVQEGNEAEDRISDDICGGAGVMIPSGGELLPSYPASFSVSSPLGEKSSGGKNHDRS